MVSFNEQSKGHLNAARHLFQLLIAVLLCSMVHLHKYQKVAPVLRNQSKLGGGSTKIIVGTLQRTPFNSYREQETLMFMSLLWGNSWSLFQLY